MREPIESFSVADPCKIISPDRAPLSKGASSVPRQNEPLFTTITAEDWKRSLISARQQPNAVSAQILTRDLVLLAEDEVSLLATAEGPWDSLDGAIRNLRRKLPSYYLMLLDLTLRRKPVGRAKFAFNPNWRRS